MTTVLVWQSHGTVRVHPADTIGHLVMILAEISNCVANWDVEEELERTVMAATRFSEKSLDRSRAEIRSFCQRHSDHETFETFEFCNIEELA